VLGLLSLPPAADPDSARVPLTAGQGAEDLGLRLDQQAYRERVSPEALERARTMGDRYRREWLRGRPSGAGDAGAPRVAAPGPLPRPATPVSPAVRDSLEREWVQQRQRHQQETVEEAILRRREASGEVSRGEVARKRMELQGEAAAEALQRQLSRPSAGAVRPPVDEGLQRLW
jgi:hypothetical protein